MDMEIECVSVGSLLWGYNNQALFGDTPKFVDCAGQIRYVL